MSHPSSSCQHDLLAHGTVGQVSVCPDCGVIHLELHGLTVRFSVAAFADLADMLTKAQKHLPASQTCERPVAGSPAHLLH